MVTKRELAKRLDDLRELVWELERAVAALRSDERFVVGRLVRADHLEEHPEQRALFEAILDPAPPLVVDPRQNIVPWTKLFSRHTGL